MDLQTLIKDAKERFGFEEAGALNVEALEFLPEVRQMCAADRCRSFNRNWSCPPGCGTLEADLADALEQGTIAAAGLDVLSVEPMREDNPLRRIKDSERLVITPHIAWAAVETRKRLMEIILQQVKEFFERR